MGSDIKAGVVIFPGSNCDQDMIDALRGPLGWDVTLLWHKDSEIPTGLDVIALPGGFTYGDYLRAGAIARFSPVMRGVVEFAGRGGLVIGVCNGFQILTEVGLLPGALHRNASLRFRCHDVRLKVENTDTPFTNAASDSVLRIPIAHGEGNYTIDAEGLAELNGEGRVVFRYCDAEGRIAAEANPNGSLESIAGICNEGRNVLGMMPHPERVCESEVGGVDGLQIFGSIASALESSRA